MVRKNKTELRLEGIPAADGICQGKAFVLGQVNISIPRYELDRAQIELELVRLRRALGETRLQLQQLQNQVTETVGAHAARIFEAHLLMLEDPVFTEEVTQLIKKEKVNAEYAFWQVAQRYIEALSNAQDELIRERATDIRDLTTRVVQNLAGRMEAFDLQHLQEPCIIIAHDLSPSVTAQLNKKIVLGFATDIGSPTSHAAIMARSMGIPAVVGLRDASVRVPPGAYVLLDGYQGLLIVNPTETTLHHYDRLVKRRISLEEKLRRVIHLPAVTIDGRQIIVSANIEKPDDTDVVIASGAEGVGLFRTEYLFLNSDKLPTEEEQYNAYRRVAVALKPNPVIIRTLDLGGDKFLSHLNLAPEVNPFLGWRAIRFCLQQPELFKTQLRAILRASVEGNVKLMYPMVTALDELLKANELVEQALWELRREGMPCPESPEIGVMIETPSAVLIADVLAKHVRFFSIGSNDLVQYTLATDRTNERVAHLYEPTHPAVLKLIKMTIDAAHAVGIWVGVCGEIASDPIMIPILVGLGIDELSAAPPLVPRVKFLIRHMQFSEARALALECLTHESGAQTTKASREFLKSIAADLLEALGERANKTSSSK
jgi:phosphotransferase system enzyme I (PtsI)